MAQTALEGDRDACSRLFAAHWPLVHAWMLGYTKDRVEAEDLTQQTFLRAYTRLGQLRDPARFLPWLRRVARTVALGSRLRRGVRLRPEPVVEAAGAVAERRETRTLVVKALDRLPSRDRRLLLLYLEDLPLARISELLGIPVTTLRRRIRAALDRFRARLEREGRIP